MVGINDVILHSLLGKGSFGSVYLVELKNNLNKYYAMKVLEKSKMKSILKIYKIKSITLLSTLKPKEMY